MIRKYVHNILSFINYWICRNDQSKIIFYHDIHDKTKYCDTSTSLNLFKQHISLIRSLGFEITNNISKPRKQIIIQFDDGFKGIYDCLPFIVEHSIPIELFIIVDKIDSENYLTANQIVELKKTKLIKLSSHTYSHPNLADCTEIQLIKELKESKEKLEDLFEITVSSICFPKGLFSKNVVEKSFKYGYHSQYCSIPGSYKNKKYQNVYNRNLVQFLNVDQLKRVLLGGAYFFDKWFWIKHYKK